MSTLPKANIIWVAVDAVTWNDGLKGSEWESSGSCKNTDCAVTVDVVLGDDDHSSFRGSWFVPADADLTKATEGLQDSAIAKAYRAKDIILTSMPAISVHRLDKRGDWKTGTP